MLPDCLLILGLAYSQVYAFEETTRVSLSIPWLIPFILQMISYASNMLDAHSV